MTAKLMTDDKTSQVFKQMNDQYNKAKSTASQIFHSFSRSEVQSEHENSHLFFVIFLLYNQEQTGQLCKVRFRVCVTIAAQTVIFLPSSVDPVAEVVIASQRPDSSVAGETHAFLFPQQQAYQCRAPDYPKCLYRSVPQHVAQLWLQRRACCCMAVTPWAHCLASAFSINVHTEMQCFELGNVLGLTVLQSKAVVV